MSRLIACVDVGSTYTKAAIVSTSDGELLATGAHPTTLSHPTTGPHLTNLSHLTTAGSDVLHGLDAAIAATGITPDEVRVCSSAGGGLRLAVIGYEKLVTAHAGHRVGLSAGAKVVHIAAGRLDHAALAQLRAARPDVILLVGGTDGGDEEVIVHNAGMLARSRMRSRTSRVPVVLAGNAEVTDALAGVLRAAGTPVTPTPNVLPAIGVLNPAPARAAIREVFLHHVIGGKGLSRGPRFASLVRAATPDAVLRGVELLGDHLGVDLLVVDVGGATTDVYSVLTPDAERASVRREAAGTLWRSRTVEGDLGVRWSAPTVIEAARLEKLPVDDVLEREAALRGADPGFLARVADSGSDPADLAIATLAATIALRRHARGEAVEAGGPRIGGVDLRDVRLVIGSGGVLRHSPPGAARAVLAAAIGDAPGGWPLPRDPVVTVDSAYVLAAAGLLAEDHPAAALGLLARLR